MTLLRKLFTPSITSLKSFHGVKQTIMNVVMRHSLQKHAIQKQHRDDLSIEKKSKNTVDPDYPSKSHSLRTTAKRHLGVD